MEIRMISSAPSKFCDERIDTYGIFTRPFDIEGVPEQPIFQGTAEMCVKVVAEMLRAK